MLKSTKRLIKREKRRLRKEAERRKAASYIMSVAEYKLYLRELGMIVAEKKKLPFSKYERARHQLNKVGLSEEDWKDAVQVLRNIEKYCVISFGKNGGTHTHRSVHVVPYRIG